MHAAQRETIRNIRETEVAMKEGEPRPTYTDAPGKGFLSFFFFFFFFCCTHGMGKFLGQGSTPNHNRRNL